MVFDCEDRSDTATWCAVDIGADGDERGTGLLRQVVMFRDEQLALIGERQSRASSAEGAP